MLFVLIALAAINLLLLAVLLSRKPVADTSLAALPGVLSTLQVNLQSLETQMRNGIGDLRRDQQENAQALRAEVTHTIGSLQALLQTQFDGFRVDNRASSETLRVAVSGDLEKIGQRLSGFIADAGRAQGEAREALHGSLNTLSTRQTEQGERLRDVVQQRIDKLNQDNAAKLEEMRQTVDEKLHATLQTRLTESFGQVTTHLGEVQKGLGEMKELATGVSDLKKVFSNVKSRGVVGEFQLGMQLEQMFSPEQYVKNARIKPNTLETVEYALKFPSSSKEGSDNVLLPIDAKFPREDWERLEHAYEHGTAEEIARAGTAFERAIRTEGKRICEKYIAPPKTLPHAIMFLPTEALYAEVVRRPGLQSDVQQNCSVTIAGPSTFMAILTSFQMGFHSIALERKGDEIRTTLSAVKLEFGKFGELMKKVEGNVTTVQNTLSQIGVRTRAINKSLSGVTALPAGDGLDNIAVMEEIASVAPLLAAAGDDE